MKNEAPTTLDTVLADGSLYQTAPAALRERLAARLREAEAEAETETSAALHADAAPLDATNRDAAPVGVVDAMAPSKPDMPGVPADHRQVRGARDKRKPRVARLPFRFFGFAPTRYNGWSFACGGLAGVAMSVLVGFTVFRGMPWPSSSASVTRSQPTWIEQEIVASHVRALISSRDMDVLSSDQHTVKPWFNGRIDYAPPVVDPRADGFPLVGGRLDYIDGRPVSVMVYRYLKHPVDLYVFPETDENPPASNAVSDAPKRMSKNGYSIIAWKQNGMRFWAITDASMSNLTSFVDAVRRMT